MIKCTSCGYENTDDSVFCEGCGGRLIMVPRDSQGSKKNKRKQEIIEDITTPAKYKVLIILGIIVAVVLAAGIIIWFLFGGTFGKSSKEKDTNSVVEESSDIIISESEEEEPEIIILPADKDKEEMEHVQEETITNPEPEEVYPSLENELAEEVVIQNEPEVPTAGNILGESQVTDLDTAIQDIKDIYYGIQNNLGAYSEVRVDSNVTRYLDANGYIAKISMAKEALSDIPIGTPLGVEYYYEVVDGNYYLRFIYAFGGDVSHRIYLDEDGVCIRYIDSAKNVYNYQDAVNQLMYQEDLLMIYEMGIAAVL